MGKADAVFMWHVPEYFEIIPSNGVLAPGQNCELTVKLTIKVRQICEFNGKESMRD